MRKRKNLTDDERIRLKDFLLEGLADGPVFALKRGVLKEGADYFSVTKGTVSRLWKLWREKRNHSINGEWDVTSGIKKNGPAVKHNRDGVSVSALAVPLSERWNIRSMAVALDIPKSSLSRMIADDGVLVPHTSVIKPTFTEQNKYHRVEFCLSERAEEGGLYKDFYDRVHIDEKWFYLTQIKERYYLAPGEEPPKRAIQSKSFIPKIMFLVAVARPRWDHDRNRMFDGKIGMWPFAQQVPAERNSVNRPRGTLEWKEMKVTKEVYRQFLHEKLVPAIKERFPRREGQTIYIQQDNARPHIQPEEFSTKLLQQDGANLDDEERQWDLQLYFQPPNSPDLNVLDLGFFRSLQSMQFHVPSKDIEEMMARVRICFDEYPHNKLNNIFLTLQTCMNEIIDCDGGNHYDIVHLNKLRLERLGELPQSIYMTDRANDWLNGANLQVDDG